MLRLGLGTAPLGGLYREVPAETARARSTTAWELGVRYFDTAPLYGYGLAERRLGDALAGRPAKRVHRVDEGRARSCAPEGRARSSRALRPSRRSTTSARMASGARSPRASSGFGSSTSTSHSSTTPSPTSSEARRALETVRELVARVGVGTNVVATALALVERGEVDVVLLAGRYTLLDRSAADELLPLCAELGVPVMAAGVFNSGLLAGGSTFDYGAAPPAILERRQALEAMCAATTCRWRQPRSSSRSVTPRCRRSWRCPLAAGDPGRRAALQRPIPDDLWRELERS